VRTKPELHRMRHRRGEPDVARLHGGISLVVFIAALVFALAAVVGWAVAIHTVGTGIDGLLP
jgi:hypothetical protein